jgi:Flp pilus assembly protein TadG
VGRLQPLAGLGVSSRLSYQRRTRRGERGYVLVVMALTGVVLFGFLGLAMDVGRMYIAKNEAQAFADAGALAAALVLDGTSTGVTNAQTAASSLGNKWNFLSSAFSGTTVAVATSSAGPWTSAGSPPSPATNYTYVKVTANVSVGLYFAPVVTAFAGSSVTSSPVQAMAVAAQLPQTTFNTGAFPFSPMAFDGSTNTGGAQTSAPWGFVAGSQYTIRYASNGKSECAGDSGDSNHLANGSARGFWGDNSANVITQQIEGLTQEESLTVGELLPGVGGAKTSVQSAIADRIGEDGDTTDTTYAAYEMNSAANGQRVVVMPIQSEVTGDVLGFGTFFLLPASDYDHTGNSNWCAIYIGLANVLPTGGTGASSTAGAYQVMLVQ